MSISNNKSPNGSSSALKYGDADLVSKRRKLTLDQQRMQQQQQTIVEHNIIDSEEYLSFEQIAGDSCMNSSFQDAPTTSLDFMGGLLSSSSSLLTSIDETSAKDHDLTITSKPSITSKGFENTFKLLQSQVTKNSQKTICRMQSLNAESSLCATINEIPEDGQEPPTCLDLELEAMQRIRALVENVQPQTHLKQERQENCDSTISTPLLTLLYDFVSRGLSKEQLTHGVANEDYHLSKESNYAGINSNIIYHASRGADGQKCLKIVRSLLLNRVLCGNRVSQMTRAYDDIEAVTRLLEEKEKDLELTVQIGKELLTQNNTLENRINELEADLKASNDDRAQLVHELHKKNELISVLTNDADDGSETDTPTFSKSITLDLLQKKIASLQDENKSLKTDVSQLASETDAVEAHERRLMEDITTQLNDANSQFDHLSLELERQREENRLQHEQIVSLTARLAEAEMRLHQLTHDNDEHMTLLSITKENQNSLALELVEFKQRYQEVLALLQEAQEQLRKQRKKTQPQARSSFISSIGGGLLAPDSLQSELMESSLYSENSLDSGISGDNQRINDRIGRLMSQSHMSGGGGVYGGMAGAAGLAYGGAIPPYKRVFETVRCASKNGNYMDSGNVSMTQLGAMSMSSASVPRMSATTYGVGVPPAGSFYRNSGCYESNSMMMGMGHKTLSCESLASASDDGYPSAQPSGVPGAPGAKDLEAALKRLTPADVLARRAMLSYGPAGTYAYDEQPPSAAVLPLGIRTPDSIMSTGSSGIMSSSSTTNMSSSSMSNQWRLPEKLQIVKPIEGSQTLHHWSRLATPTLSGLLEERPGVTIRGGRGLDDLGMHVYTLSDVEEDISEELPPGKQFEAPGCIYTYTTSMVMHPDDGLVNDLSFLSQSQMSSRMASASTSRQPSCPPTPRAGLSRKNSCSTFSVNLGLASMLNERGIKAVTPSALNTPAGPNFSPTVTPCNSPEGSPTRSRSPEPLFGLLSSGADLIRRKLVGGDIERPNRNQQQKIMLSRLERRALRSLKLVEKVESIGLENIIATQPSAMSQLASGIANRSGSPMSQLTSLKHIHTSSNNIVDDIHFDRDQIKGVLHRGLNSSTASSSSNSSAYNSDNDELQTVTKKKHSKTPTATRDKEEGISIIHNRSTTIATGTSSVAAQSQSTTEAARVKQMQRQKSRRNLKNGIAAQRPDLGTIGGGGRLRPDLGKVSPPVKLEQATVKDEEKVRDSPQSITQAFVGSVSSLLFGRKGGWL